MYVFIILTLTTMPHDSSEKQEACAEVLRCPFE